MIAQNSEEAIKTAEQAGEILPKPDLILLDIMMPKINGIETLKHLKSDNKTKDISSLINQPRK